MNMKLKFFSLIFCLLFIHVASANDTQQNNDITQKFITSISQQTHGLKFPAYAALIFKGEEILYQYTSGHSNIEDKIPLKPDDVFLMASVSKMITATALLQLYQKGVFELDDPINDYLPFRVENPRHKTPITFRMLLTHTSSIADGSAVDEQYYFGQDPQTELSDFMQQYFTPTGIYYDAGENFHNVKPGTEFHYSNEASALIGVLVETITNVDFAQYTQDNIFIPLRMTASHWRLANAKNTIVYPVDSGEMLDHYTFTDYPNGGLHSNIYDMHNFLQMIANGGSFRGKQILEPNTVAQMLTPQIPNIDPSVGLHIFKGEYGSGMWGHEGGEEGVTTFIGVNPKTKIGVVLLSNISNADITTSAQKAYQTALDLINFSKNH